MQLIRNEARNSKKYIRNVVQVSQGDMQTT